MTDLDNFVALYKSFGIECKVMDLHGGKAIALCVDSCSGFWDHEGTNSDKITGYGGFYTVIQFSNDGKFIHQRIEE